MTDVSTMSDRELDRAIAEAVGWEQDPPETGAWYELGNQACHFSADVEFSTNLNALRDGPERVLREAGWTMELLLHHAYAIRWTNGYIGGVPFQQERAQAPTEARARAEAALQALQVMKGEGNG